MIYIIDNDIWKKGSENEIRTDIGNVVMRIESKSTTFGKKIILYDRYHVEIGSLKKRGFSNFSYDIYYDESVIGTILKKRVLFSKRLIIKSFKGQEFRIKGSVPDRTFDIYKGLKRIARVHPKLVENKEQYGFECIDEENKYLLLCGVIALGLG